MSLFHAGIASATLLLAVVGTSAQQKPNFSGTWVVVSPAESAGEETTIKHDATTFTHGHASEGGGHSFAYTLDGKETRITMPSHSEEIVILAKASWEGDRRRRCQRTELANVSAGMRHRRSNAARPNTIAPSSAGYKKYMRARSAVCSNASPYFAELPAPSTVAEGRAPLRRQYPGPTGYATHEEDRMGIDLPGMASPRVRVPGVEGARWLAQPKLVMY